MWIHRASTPAKGPSPTATMNSIANTISLMARQASMTRRTGWYTQRGTMLDEDSRPKGTAHATARKVPHSAICTVTTISSR